MRAPQEGEAGNSRAFRCAVAGWAGAGTVQLRAEVTCPTDSDGFLSSSPSPCWQILLIDVCGGSWLQIPKDTLVNLYLSFPFLLTRPLPWVGDTGVDHIPVPGMGILFSRLCSAQDL